MEQRDITLCLAISDAVTESIENMVFMAIDTDLDGASDDVGPDAVVAALKVHEPRSGELRLAMPRRTAAELARALYSISSAELTEDIVRDVVCELLNTISGRVMKRVLPSECTFHLGLPVIADTSLPDMPEPYVRCSFLADGNLLTVTLCLGQ